MVSKGQWTILIYANGNNELEPEIYEAFKCLLKMSIPENINVAVEIGREDRKIARMLRPYTNIKYDNDIWSGVRRYCVKNGRLVLDNDMGSINMADPRTLEEFIQWGTNSFPSEHIALYISGHGAAIAGNLTDYSQKLPYIMDTKDMCMTVSQSFISLKRKLELVIFDMCYMNYIEIAYELSVNPKCQIDNYITYVDEGPMWGLDLVGLVDLISSNKNAESIGMDIINNMREPLVLINLKHGRMKRIKKISHEAGKLVNAMKHEEGFTYENLLSCTDIPQIETLKKELGKLCICSMNTGESISIKILDFEMEELVDFYRSYSFSQNNDWINVISEKGNVKTKLYKKSSPRIIDKSALIGLILSSNENMDINEAIRLMNDLVSIKRWQYKF